MELVQIIDGQPRADSLTVAEVFGKRHDDVRKAIRNLDCSPEFLSRNFAEKPQPSTGGRPTLVYDMTRDGFVFLAMGFTGAKAAEWKEAYISAFNDMEARLKSQPSQIDVRDPGQLAAIAIQLIEVNKELEGRAVNAEAQVEAAKPKTAFYDNFANAEGLYGLQNAARVLGQPPNKFIQWLKQTYLFYQGGALIPRARFREMGLFEVKLTMVDEKSRYRTWVTPQGIQYFAKKLEVPQPGLLPISPK